MTAARIHLIELVNRVYNDINGEDVDSLGEISEIMANETTLMVAANNALAELSFARPLSRPANTKVENDNPDSIRELAREVIAEHKELVEFTSKTMPLYESIAEHSGNVAIALRAILDTNMVNNLQRAIDDAVDSAISDLT